MIEHFRNRHLLATDVALLNIAAYASFVLRLEQYDLGEYWLGHLSFTLAMLLSTVLLFGLSGLYSQYWPYASVEELVRLCGVCTLATLIGLALSLAPYAMGDRIVFLPRSVPF